jgi:hypothetical protein
MGPLFYIPNMVSRLRLIKNRTIRPNIPKHPNPRANLIVAPALSERRSVQLFGRFFRAYGINPLVIVPVPLSIWPQLHLKGRQ